VSTHEKFYKIASLLSAYKGGNVRFHDWRVINSIAHALKSSGPLGRRAAGIRPEQDTLQWLRLDHKATIASEATDMPTPRSRAFCTEAESGLGLNEADFVGAGARGPPFLPRVCAASRVSSVACNRARLEAVSAMANYVFAS